MRLIAFIFLAALCQIYGLGFDLVAGGGLGTGICDLARAQECLVTERADHLLSALILMVLAPVAGVYLYGWFSRNLRFARSTAFLGLLLVTA